MKRAWCSLTAPAVGAALTMGAAMCGAQAVAPFNHLPPALHHDKPAADAVEQRAREEAVFRYYAAPVSKPAHVAVRLDTPVKRMYRTRLREAVKSDTLFAGTVGVEEFGCGTGCVSLALADRRNGNTALMHGISSAWSNRRVVFHPGSRALLVVGEVEEENPGERWYVWTGSALQLVAFHPLNGDCFGMNEDGKLGGLWNSAACNFMPPEAPE